MALKKKAGKRKRTAPKSSRSKRRKQGYIELDLALELALKQLREGQSQRAAARIAGVSVGRFRRFLDANRLAHFRKSKWRITDRRVREVAAHTTRGYKQLKLRGFSQTSLAMRHLAARNAFLASNDVALLAPFNGASVTDIAGKKHFLETRPNVLLRRANAGSEVEMRIYRLID